MFFRYPASVKFILPIMNFFFLSAMEIAVESFFSRDYPVIMALIIIGTTAFALANLIVDLIYPIIDPRIRVGGGAND